MIGTLALTASRVDSFGYPLAPGMVEAECYYCWEPLHVPAGTTRPACRGTYCRDEANDWYESFWGEADALEDEMARQAEAWADHLYTEYAADIAACDPYGDFWDVGPGWTGRIAA
jgi:hypothetical protein